MQQVHHPVAHLARQQLVRLLSLLPLGDIKEDAEHNPVGYVRIVSLTSSGNPPDIGARKDTKIDLVSAHNCARSRKC
jgi:hypothetical protein